MRYPSSPIFCRLRFALLLIINLIWLLSGSALQTAANENPLRSPAAEINLPDQFGEIVYQTQTAASSRIYIIANGHRSAISGDNAAETLQAQIETFRIGEWLINQNRIDLLLPEGFFGEMGAVGVKNRPLDSQTLQDALVDTSLFVNAELLLHENYGIGLNQIEDRKLYLHVRDRLRTSLEPETQFSTTLNHELSYLQKLRTANILQTAPAVVAAAYQQGRIAAPNAMLTIGLSHLEDLIAFLEAGEINVAGLHTTNNTFPPHSTELKLLEKQVSVTVIVPRTLFNQRI